MKQINFRKNEKITVGLILLLLCIFLAVLVPALSPWTSTEMHADIRNQGISFSHPFGTDKFGRDLFVRVWCGVRISLCVGLASALLNGALGVLYGAASGYAGKAADNILMRIKEREFVLASRLAGAGPLRIFLTHLLPNAAGPIVVSLTFLVPQAIFTEAFLSFMGVGIPAPRASLGTMIQAARSQIFVHPYQMLIPTAVLCILILSLNLIGAGLEAKIRRRREGM